MINCTNRRSYWYKLIIKVNFYESIPNNRHKQRFLKPFDGIIPPQKQFSGVVFSYFLHLAKIIDFSVIYDLRKSPIRANSRSYTTTPAYSTKGKKKKPSKLLKPKKSSNLERVSIFYRYFLLKMQRRVRPIFYKFMFLTNSLQKQRYFKNSDHRKSRSNWRMAILTNWPQ